eukprot:gene2465-2768_t
MLQPPQGLLPDVAAALAPSGFAGFHAEQLVLLDALLGLCCLMCGGASSVKLQLCYWTLDKSGSHDLSLQEVLACIPALQLAGAAAQIILRQTTRQTLTAEQANPKAQAVMKQRLQLLSSILQQAFQEADSRATGVIKPHGDQRLNEGLRPAGALSLVPDHPGLPAGISRRAMQLPGLTAKNLHPGFQSPVQGLLGLASEEVGMNGVLMLMLVLVLVVVRVVNANNSRSLTEVANGPQGSGPRAVLSSSGGGAEGMGGGGSGLGAGYHQSRAVRIAGTASSAAAREGMYFMPSSNVRQAYPQL